MNTKNNTKKQMSNYLSEKNKLFSLLDHIHLGIQLIIIAILILLLVVMFKPSIDNKSETEESNIEIVCQIPFSIFISNETYEVIVSNGLCNFTSKINMEDLE